MLPALIAIVYIVLQIVGKPTLAPANDAYRYNKAALRLLGDSPEQAHRTALKAYCHDQVRWETRRHGLRPESLRDDAAPYPTPEKRFSACMAASADGLKPTSPRYERIFDVRPGFPVLAAPFVAVFGAGSGLLVTSVLFTVAGGLFAFLLLRAVGAPARIALVGQAFFYACPIGWWGGYPLTEGPVLALTMSALLGAWWMFNRRLAEGTLLLAGSMVVGTAVKYSTFLLIAGALAAAATVCLALVAGTRHRGTYLMAALNAAVVLGIGALSIRYSLPGSAETLQDTFTDHFAQSDVAAPWPMLGELNGNYWTSWIQEQVRSPWLIAAVGLGTWGLFRHSRVLGWLVVAVGLTGIAAEVAHPVDSQGDRLMLNVWVIAVLGLPLLLHQLLRKRLTSSPS
ncbi:hypothetical protein ACWCQQ_37055 [Streptomyces sp. NPDC002143]